jgi:hypothetical protein
MTVKHLELISNVIDSKSKHSLLGILAHTKTDMGGTALRLFKLLICNSSIVACEHSAAIDGYDFEQD